MKIERLRIDAFGHFQSFEAELDPGLNVLHGSNEAGKSTLLAFIRAVLFGFERRAHPGRYEPTAGAMGGELLLSTRFGPLRVRRQAARKRAEGELVVRDGDGNPLPETRLSEALCGVSRELFFEVFAFGLDELASFSRLAAQGEVSEALFAAGMQGAQRLPLTLERLRTSSEKIYSQRAVKPELNRVLQELSQVQATLAALGDRPALYAEAVAQLQGVQGAIATAEATLPGLTADVEQLEALVSVLADLSAREACRVERAVVPDMRGFPPGVVARFDDLAGRHQQGRAELERLRRLTAELERDWAWLRADPETDAREARLREALDGFLATLEQRRALPARSASLAARRRQLAEGVRGLGIPLAEWELIALDLGAAGRSELGSLRDRRAEQLRLLEQRTDRWQRERSEKEKIEAEVRRLTSEVARLPATAGGLVRRTLHALQQVAPIQAERVRLNEQAADRHAAALNLRMQASADPAPRELFPLWAASAAVGLPIALVVGALATGRGSVELAVGAAGLVGLLVAVRVRAARWFKEGTAAHARRAEGRAQELARLEGEGELLAHRLEDLNRELAQACEDGGAPPNPAADVLASRLEDARALLEKVERRERLAEELEGHSARLAQASRAERDARADRDVTEAGLSQLDRAVDVLLETRCLPRGLTPERALDLWNELATLRQRLLDLKAEQSAYDAEELQCARAAARLVDAAKVAGISPEGPEAAAVEVRRLLERRQTWEAERAAVAERRTETAAQLARASHLVQQLEGELRALLQSAGAQDGEELRAREVLASRWEAAERGLRESTLRIEARTGRHADDVAEQVRARGGESGVTGALLAARAAGERLANELKRKSEERGRLGEKLARWETDDETATLRFREEQLRARAHALAGRFAVDRVALALLGRARRRFEQEQQPRVVQLASGTFGELTAGRYTNVYLSADEPGQLKVLDRKGTEWPAVQLSRGTREQLYLAFRLAVIEDFGETRAPLPIIVDDILVNFDPERMRSTVKVLARLARRHQVIAFTCHPNLKDTFKREGAQVVDVAPRQLTLLSGGNCGT